MVRKNIFGKDKEQYLDVTGTLFMAMFGNFKKLLSRRKRYKVKQTLPDTPFPNMLGLLHIHLVKSP